MKISRELLLYLSYGDEPESNRPDATPWMTVENEITGSWRWGTEHRIILQHGTSLWGWDYRTTTGDEYQNDIEDQPAEVELYPVHDEVECKTVYRRVPDATA